MSDIANTTAPAPAQAPAQEQPLFTAKGTVHSKDVVDLGLDAQTNEPRQMHVIWLDTEDRGALRLTTFSAGIAEACEEDKPARVVFSETTQEMVDGPARLHRNLVSVKAD